jgi:hypothetical protein
MRPSRAGTLIEKSTVPVLFSTFHAEGVLTPNTLTKPQKYDIIKRYIF